MTTNGESVRQGDDPLCPGHMLTDTPVHLLHAVTVGAMATLPPEAWASEVCGVHMDEGQEEQEGRGRVTGGRDYVTA